MLTTVLAINLSSEAVLPSFEWLRGFCPLSVDVKDEATRKRDWTTIGQGHAIIGLFSFL